MSKPQQHEESTPGANRRIAWWILLAALVWGLMIGVGAFLQDWRRGVIVFAVVLVLAGLWAALQLAFERRRNSPQMNTDENR
jgi:Flp pilus assembly protein TadB